MKHHLSPDGKIRPCKAEKKDCAFGLHFTDEKQIEQHYEGVVDWQSKTVVGASKKLSGCENSFEHEIWYKNDKGKIVAFARVFERLDEIEVCDIEVREGERKKGYGRKLLQSISAGYGRPLVHYGSFTPEGRAAFGGEKYAENSGGKVADPSTDFESMTFVYDWDSAETKYPVHPSLEDEPYCPNNPPRYHVTRKSNLESIMKEGLKAQTGERSSKIGEKQDSVYLFVDKESVQDATWLAEEFDEEEEIVVLEVEGVRRRYENDYEIKARNINPQRLKVTDIQF